MIQYCIIGHAIFVQKIGETVMESGIYRIRNVVNEKMYIGQSINVKNRLRNHLKELQSGGHMNYLLQRDFDKYKEENFIFEKIHTCEEEFLNPMEKYFIEKYNTTYNGYNIKNGNSKISAKIKEDLKKEEDEKQNELRLFEELQSIDIEIDSQKLDSFKPLKDIEYFVVDIDCDTKGRYNLNDDAQKLLVRISDAFVDGFLTNTEIEIFDIMIKKLTNKFSKVIIIDEKTCDWAFLWGDSKDEYYIEFSYKNILNKCKEESKEIKINLIGK